MLKKDSYPSNQLWSLLPHGKVKEYLEYKAKEYGIGVEYISEAYTSGVDSSVGGAVSKETYTPEARIKRGLFKTKFLGLLNTLGEKLKEDIGSNP